MSKAVIPLLNAKEISKTFGHKKLFGPVDLAVAGADKIGIVGENGSGKSTFLKILRGELDTDSGQIVYKQGLRMSYLAQEDDFKSGTSAYDILKQAFAGRSAPAYEIEKDIAIAVKGLGLGDLHRPVDDFSGGNRKRLAIVQCFLQKPEFVFVDEPTNHLDLKGIAWLSRIFSQQSVPMLIISHDRYFLDAVCTKILEIGSLTDNKFLLIDGNYDHFCREKQAQLDIIRERQRSLKGLTTRESEWLSRSPKARTTKSQSRVEAAQRLLKEYQHLKQLGKKPDLNFAFQGSGKKAKKLLELKNLLLGYDEKPVIADLDFTLYRGMKVGILGNNGSGKSTLIGGILGTLEPMGGSIFKAENLTIAYFDQHRRQLKDQEDLRDFLADGHSQVLVGERKVELVSFCQRFRFTREQLSKKFSSFSGGEKARAMLAKIMITQADILILDEPTNDMDIESIENLQEALIESDISVLLVSHDRQLMENVCDYFIGLHGGEGSDAKNANKSRSGASHGLYASIEQWQAELKKIEKAKAAKSSAEQKEAKQAASADQATQQIAPTKAKKLSYMEQREYDKMEAQILEVEKIVEAKQAIIDSGQLNNDFEALTKESNDLSAATQNLEKLYERWAELEAKQK